MIPRAYNKRGLVTFIDGEILNVTKNKLTRVHVIVSARTHAKHARVSTMRSKPSNDLRAVMDKGKRLALTLADGIRFLRLGWCLHRVSNVSVIRILTVFACILKFT